MTSINVMVRMIFVLGNYMFKLYIGSVNSSLDISVGPEYLPSTNTVN